MNRSQAETYTACEQNHNKSESCKQNHVNANGY